MSIPKIVHYCWFGKGEKPKDVQQYIENWHKVLPEYEIIEWNEENFDIHINTYVEEAYQAKKYAFVSDYARLFALYNHGGIYLDTDVEVLKPFDDLLENDMVLGFEEKGYIATSTICAKKQSTFIQEFMSLYQNKRFILEDGQCDMTTNVTKITSLLKPYGLIENEKTQTVSINDTESIMVLDRIKFSPYDYLNQINYADSSTYAIHHFGATWANNSFKYKKKLKGLVIKIIGSKNYEKLHSLLK